jgi:hypothetical protein
MLLAGTPAPAVVEVPVLYVTNKHARCSAVEVSRFRSVVWDEAVRVFARCGVLLRVVERTGEVLKYPSGRPRFLELDRRRVNVVLSDNVPLDWDNARYSPGIAAAYEGFAVCVIAMPRAHANRIPFLAVNTVVHELLHILLEDIFVAPGGLLRDHGRETRVDWHATRMWLFGADATVRESAREFMRKRLLRTGS